MSGMKPPTGRRARGIEAEWPRRECGSGRSPKSPARRDSSKLLQRLPILSFARIAAKWRKASSRLATSMPSGIVRPSTLQTFVT